MSQHHLTGDMPLSVWILGNAGFQLILLVMMSHRRGSWTIAAVWHATLNAFGGAFFFSMVTGPDRDRLDLLLGLVYALVGAVALAVYVLAGRGRRQDDEVDLDRTSLDPRPEDAIPSPTR